MIRGPTNQSQIIYLNISPRLLFLTFAYQVATP